jgi:hypothetical protein
VTDGAAIDVDTLRVGLELGRYTRGDVTAWVDEAVLCYERVPDALLELSTITHRSIEEIVALLAELSPGGVDLWRLAVTMFADDFRCGRRDLVATVVQVLNAAYRAGMYETPALDTDLFQLEDGLDLATSGTYGTLDEVRLDLERFFAKYERNTST